jgi:three-Cys-motif partner protein
VTSRKDQLKKTTWPSDPHTMVKHMVYRHYLECWMAKICQKFPRSVIVDAFSGPGAYSDGPVGSPLLAMKTFLGHSAYANFNSLEIICLEERPDRVQRLRQEVAAMGHTPKLTVSVQEPGKFTSQQSSLSQLAHDGKANRPVLWLLDPFAIKALPFSNVADCLAGDRDEAVVTFFTEEMHRFCTRENFDKTLDLHFGSNQWSAAATLTNEGRRKEALVRAYRDALEARGLLTEDFGVRVRNDTPRYSLIFATHSQFGLACWNPVKWKLDSYAGSGASASTAMQPDLFGTSVTDELREALSAFVGSEQHWTVLMGVAARAGFMEKHLREALDAMAKDGIAIRVEPTKATSRWPDTSVVRFYTSEDVDLPVVEPMDADPLE